MPEKTSSDESVVAKISCVRRAAGEPLETYFCDLPEGITRCSNVDQEEHDTNITDLRTVPQEFSLERNGFKLARLIVPDTISWQDEAEVRPDVPIAVRDRPQTGLSWSCTPSTLLQPFGLSYQVKRLFYPRLEELLLKETDATRVYIFDHFLREGTAKTFKYVLPIFAEMLGVFSLNEHSVRELAL